MQIDMPVAELEKWRGSNPRPDDFDDYWARALAEADTVDPAPKLETAGFTCPFADCFDLWFTGVRGARIHAKYVRPKKAGPFPAVFHFHGYSLDSGDWVRLLPYAAAGMAIAAMDCRGQGGPSEDTGGVKGNTLHGHIIRGLDDGVDNLLFRHIFLDTVCLVRVVSGFSEVDRERLGCFGGSQGGALTAACAALSPGIRRAAPQYPFLCDFKRVWEMDLAANYGYGELTEYFRRFDPRHEREDEIFTKLGYIDVQFLAPRIKAEVLMFTGLMDEICPPSSQFAMYNKIGAKKRILLYPDFAHEETYPGVGDMTFTFMSAL
ncbi:MAG: acetylxylan esterase [Treponema sp.]|jgi:cephalosporin-C deacetylase|nr:acetylxylan esterase [Treponema sp.]